MDINSYLNFVDILHDRYSKTPRKTIFRFINPGEESVSDVSYERLFIRSQSIATTLLKHARKHDRCLILFPPGIHYIEALLGCISAEVIAIPAYPPLNSKLRKNIQTIAKDSGCKIILTTGKLCSRFGEEFADTAVVATDSIKDRSITNPIVSPSDIDIDATAIIQYTSGSTGFPKGVMISHRNLSHNSMQSALAFQANSSSINVSWLPPYHDMGLIGAILNPLYDDALSILMPPTQFLQSPYRWLQTISTFGATHSGAPNFAYELCSQKITLDQKATLNLSTWKVAFNGAEPIRKETLDRFYESFKECGFSPSALRPCYGLAEATLIAASPMEPQPPLSVSVKRSQLEAGIVDISPTMEPATHTELVSCGTALLKQNISIVSPVSLEKCNNNVVGEIWIQGPSIAKGYWNNKKHTERTFNAYIKHTKQGPFLRTGDLGFVHQNNVFITGRLKDLIIINGRNLYPQDLEYAAKSSHESFRRGNTVAFSISGEYHEQLVLIQEIDKRTKSSTFELLEVIRNAISSGYSVAPNAIILVPLGELPRTTSGKIQRNQAKHLYQSSMFNIVDRWELPSSADLTSNSDIESNQLPSSATNLPHHWTEREITAWIIHYISESQNISGDQIYPEQTFSSLGLGSVQAVELSSKLESLLGIVVAPTLAWNHPTIKETAVILARKYKTHNGAKDANIGEGDNNNPRIETGSRSETSNTDSAATNAINQEIDLSKLSDQELAVLLFEKISEPTK